MDRLTSNMEDKRTVWFSFGVTNHNKRTGKNSLREDKEIKLTSGRINIKDMLYIVLVNLKKSAGKSKGCCDVVTKAFGC